MSPAPPWCRPASGNIPGVEGSSPGLLQQPWSLGFVCDRRGGEQNPGGVEVWKGGDGKEAKGDLLSCGSSLFRTEKPD